MRIHSIQTGTETCERPPARSPSSSIRVGMVKTAGGKDRRTRFVTLTPLGRDRQTAALPLWEQAQHQVARRVGGSRWREILHELSAVQTLAPDSQVAS